MLTDKLNIDIRDLSGLLDKVELIARYTGMSNRESTSMCLLAEEVITSVRNILEKGEGSLWMETSADEFKINVQLYAHLDEDARGKVLSISKSGVNTKPKGFLAKLGMALDSLLAGDPDAVVYLDNVGMSEGIMGPGRYSFSYMAYRSDIEKKPQLERDELEGIEKSIIESIADDIQVTVQSGSALVTAIKKLKK